MSEAKIRVILADDHELVLQGLKGLLEQQPDMEVLAVARNGDELLTLLDDHQPDVVVMDIYMPQLDGIEATRRIVTAAPNTKVIGYSIPVTEQDAQAFRASGGCAHVMKQEGPARLIEVIRAALSPKAGGAPAECLPTPNA